MELNFFFQWAIVSFNICCGQKYVIFIIFWEKKFFVCRIFVGENFFDDRSSWFLENFSMMTDFLGHTRPADHFLLHKDFKLRWCKLEKKHKNCRFLFCLPPFSTHRWMGRKIFNYTLRLQKTIGRKCIKSCTEDTDWSAITRHHDLWLVI